MKQKWTTADGRKLEAKDIETPHLINIIRDGYRPDFIVKEAKKRGIPVPKVEINFNPMIVMESICSCAIEGITSPATEQIRKLIENNEYVKAAQIWNMLESRKAFDNLQQLLSNQSEK